jgi:Tfp pilus assembly protein PilF
VIRRSRFILPGALAIALGIADPAQSFAVQKSAAAQQLEFGVKMALKGSWLEAAFRFDKAVKLGGTSTSARAYNNLAVAKESLGQFEQAREAYEKALALKVDEQEDRRIRENYDRFLNFLKSNRGGVGK